MNILSKYTFKTLLKNKTRTFVTIIGIALSAAMFTAVSTFVVSLRDYVIATIYEDKGSWHGAVLNIDANAMTVLNESDDVEEYAWSRNLGYAELPNSKNEYKPYMFVSAVGDGFTKVVPVHMIDGRMPQSSDEIILPAHLSSNAGIRHELGDRLTLELGYRESDGERLTQNDPYRSEQEGEHENFVACESREYTVVGFYERPSFEEYQASGYTALTLADASDDQKCDIYIKLFNATDTLGFLHDNFSDSGCKMTTNSDLLRMYRASGELTFNSVLTNFVLILIGIIMFASISLIYNAFSISVSERTKQFGLLSSLGATKKQIRQSVFMEALMVSIVGIPLGIIFGLLGIGVTLDLTQPLFASLYLGGTYNAKLTLTIDLWAILAAALIGLVTVLISAFIPAARAVKGSAIDAIRQTGDINVNAKKVKTSKLTYKLFGFEGMIASKNFKRNKKRYRATVVSLFLSIVLFISASSFCFYLSKSAGNIINAADYDIRYYYTHPSDGEQEGVYKIYSTLSNIEGVERGSYISSAYYNANIDRRDATEGFAKYAEKSDANTVSKMIGVCFVNDDAMIKFLDENGMNKELYMDASSPRGIMMNFVKYFDSAEQKYYTFGALEHGDTEIEIEIEKKIEGYTRTGIEYDENDGISAYVYSKDSGVEAFDEGEKLTLPINEAIDRLKLRVGDIVENGPLGTSYIRGSAAAVIYPYSAKDAVLNGHGENTATEMLFKASDHVSVTEKMSLVLEDMGEQTDGLYDNTKQLDASRAVITVINVFSYGFITLISLIAAANVFNTISTNISLRRREFAILRSTGMTESGFYKMMDMECLMYGMKGLALGLPVSALITYLIYISVLEGMEMAFFMPWGSVGIAVASVFIVVFATMLYSMRKIKKENIMDALKNENL